MLHFDRPRIKEIRNIKVIFSLLFFMDISVIVHLIYSLDFMFSRFFSREECFIFFI